MNIEKEVRYRIDNNIKKSILEKTEPFKEKVSMLDITFGYRGFNSLMEYGFICRVRQKPNKTTLEVKKLHNDGWLEQEIKLEDIRDGINYFNLVNMKPYMYLKRDREVRTYKNLKIFIDEIEVVGDFVEIEYQDSTNAKSELDEFLKEVKISSEPQELYGDIIKKQLKENKEFSKLYKDGLNNLLESI